MELLDPAVMLSQVARLGEDLRTLTGPGAQRVHELIDPRQLATIEKIYLTGDGDSYQASRAAQMAFETIGGVECQAISAQNLFSYGPVRLDRDPERVLVVGTSASGQTERVAQVLAHAGRLGASTLALTGRPGSLLTRVATHSLVIGLDRAQPSPGIRTYQASLLGMLLLAIQLGSVQGRGRVAVSAPAAQLRSELVDLADLVEATATEAGRRCVALAERIASSPVMVVIGSGPSQGTAMFAAAKIIEACGIFATGKDLEEWSHVERFAYPLDMPVFVIAPPGRTHQRAAEAAAQARSLGRTVIAVTDEDDTVVTAHADCVLPVAGRTREEFSPLLYHAFAAHLGCRLAQRLGRSPFQAGI